MKLWKRKERYETFQVRSATGPKSINQHKQAEKLAKDMARQAAEARYHAELQRCNQGMRPMSINETNKAKMLAKEEVRRKIIEARNQAEDQRDQYTYAKEEEMREEEDDSFIIDESDDESYGSDSEKQSGPEIVEEVIRASAMGAQQVNNMVVEARKQMQDLFTTTATEREDIEDEDNGEVDQEEDVISELKSVASKASVGSKSFASRASSIFSRLSSVNKGVEDHVVQPTILDFSHLKEEDKEEEDEEDEEDEEEEDDDEEDQDQKEEEDQGEDVNSDLKSVVSRSSVGSKSFASRASSLLSRKSTTSECSSASVDILAQLVVGTLTYPVEAQLDGLSHVRI